MTHTPLPGGFHRVLFVLYTVFYTVFARYDGWETDTDHGTFGTSGRVCYVTDDADDAARVWFDWDRGTDEPDYGFFVRRGCIEQHETLDDAMSSDAVRYADGWPDMPPSVQRLFDEPQTHTVCAGGYRG